MKFLSVLPIVILTVTIQITGQEKPSVITSPQNLFLSFRTINFIRNNEYSNPVTEGYTLIGSFLQPELVYRPSARVELRLGTHLLGYSGTNDFALIKPLFSTAFNITEKSTIIIGSLAGSDTHGMSDPHFSAERLYSSYSEEGLQFRYSGDHLFNDTWLSWENYIFRGDAEREVFTAGESFRYSVPGIAGIFQVEVPFQLQFKHYGGQISDYPEGVETFLNISAGIRAGIDIAERKYGTTGLEYLFFTGSSLTGNAVSGIRSGSGNWYRIFWVSGKSRIEAGYWNSHDFFAPNGNFIFGSVSDHLENVIVHDRKIITASVNITLLPESFLEIFLGVDGFYDIDLNRFDNAVTLHMRFDSLFRLAKVQK